jgi:hypothetical protein
MFNSWLTYGDIFNNWLTFRDIFTQPSIGWSRNVHSYHLIYSTNFPIYLEVNLTILLYFLTASISTFFTLPSLQKRHLIQHHEGRHYQRTW